MKSIKIFFLATVAIVAGLFTACSDDDFKAGPEVDGAQVYFPENVTTQHSISDDVSSIAIPVKRIAKDEALTVAVLASDESGLFTIPSSVSFAAGKETSELLITFDRTKLEDGKEYPLSFLINDEDNTTPYGNRSLDITVMPWPWVKMGTGKFREGWLSDVFTGNMFEIDVTVHSHKSKEGIYMVEEMLGWPYMTEFFGATQEELSEQFSYTPSNIVIDCSNATQVTIEEQWSGITENSNGYGNFMIASAEPGTLVNGVITFPKDGLTAKLVGLDREFPANSQGTFRIMLPGAEIVDYTLSAVYDGMKVSADGETASAVIDFTYGADVTNIRYVLVENELTEAETATLVAAIADGSAENINELQDFTVGGEKVSAEAVLPGPGTYTVVALPLDKAQKPVSGEASAASFYFPGIGGTSVPNDIAGSLYKVSAYPDAAAYVSEYPDYSSAVYEITGTEMKKIKTYFNKTSIIDNIEIQTGGLTLQDVVDKYGKELNADAMEELATTGKYWDIMINLTPGASYTLVVEATNNYGKKKLIVCEPFVTDIPPYTGELIIGKYGMSYAASAEDTFENVFEVIPTVGSNTEFFVKDFAVEDGTQWYATYDSAKSTLTMSGVQLGREDNGNLLGKFTKALTPDQSRGYGIFSFATEESEGSDPIVLTIDPASKQVSALTTDVEVPVADFTVNKIVGALAAYYADGTTITKQSGTTSAASAAKVQGVRTKIPFSSVRVPGHIGKSLDSRGLQMNATFVRNSDNTNHGVRTLSVKTAKCEPLPKQIGRRADFKIRENLPVLK